MRSLRRPVLVTLFVLLGAGLAYLAASYGWCRRPHEAVPSLLASGASDGELFAGAARLDLAPPLPAVVAGYPPPRPEASRVQSPLRARALVLQVGRLRLGIASLDLLTIPESLAAEIRGAVADLGLAHVWVIASHAHSSFGGYDRSLLAQFAGTGRFREPDRTAVERGAIDALHAAAVALAPARLEAGEGSFPAMTLPRSEGLEPDGRLTRLVFRRPSGAPVAQWVIFAAHPTLVPRPIKALAPDYPGLFSSLEENAGAGITVLTQGALGNAVAAVAVDDPAQGPERFAEQLGASVSAVPLTPFSPVRLSFTRVAVALPNPDASRLVYPFWRGLSDNALCLAAPDRAELSAMQIGPVKLLLIPGEPTPGAGQRLERDTGTQRVLALTDGYIGYVETPELVSAGIGESKRQYFRADLLELLIQGARLASDKLGFKQRASR